MVIKEIELLKELDTTKQLTFAYLTCERLFPNYVYFSNNFDFGNPQVLREAIDFLYLNIFEKDIDESKINSLTKEIENNTPDTEDFSVIFVSSALDACTSIIDSLGFLLDKDFLKIKYISSYGIETVDMFVAERENIKTSDEDFIQKINKHPLMLKELSIQKGIISFLSNILSINYDDVQTLLHLQDNNKKSNLDL